MPKNVFFLYLHNYKKYQRNFDKIYIINANNYINKTYCIDIKM